VPGLVIVMMSHLPVALGAEVPGGPSRKRPFSSVLPVHREALGNAKKEDCANGWQTSLWVKDMFLAKDFCDAQENDQVGSHLRNGKLNHSCPLDHMQMFVDSNSTLNPNMKASPQVFFQTISSEERQTAQEFNKQGSSVQLRNGLSLLQSDYNSDGEGNTCTLRSEFCSAAKEEKVFFSKTNEEFVAALQNQLSPSEEATNTNKQKDSENNRIKHTLKRFGASFSNNQLQAPSSMPIGSAIFSTDSQSEEANSHEKLQQRLRPRDLSIDLELIRASNEETSSVLNIKDGDSDILAALLPLTFYNSDAGATDTDNAEHSDSASSVFESPRQRSGQLGIGDMVDVPSPLHIAKKDSELSDATTSWDLACKDPDTCVTLPNKAPYNQLVVKLGAEYFQEVPAFDECAARVSENQGPCLKASQTQFEREVLYPPKFVSHFSRYNIEDCFKINGAFSAENGLGLAGLTPQSCSLTPLLLTGASPFTPQSNFAGASPAIRFEYGDASGELEDILEGHMTGKQSHLDDSEESSLSPIITPMKNLDNSLDDFPLVLLGATDSMAPNMSNSTAAVMTSEAEKTAENNKGSETVACQQTTESDVPLSGLHARVGPDFQAYIPLLRPRPASPNATPMKIFDARIDPLPIWSPIEEKEDNCDKFPQHMDSEYSLCLSYLERLISQEDGTDTSLVLELSALLDREIERTRNASTSAAKQPHVFGSSVIGSSYWTPQEERDFVTGIHECRRNFSRLQQHFLREKTLQDIIEYFYSTFKKSSRYKQWKKPPDLLVGRRVAKSIKSDGDLPGTIINYFSSNETKDHKEMFHIEFDNGDTEHLYRSEVEKLLMPKVKFSDDAPI